MDCAICGKEMEEYDDFYECVCTDCLSFVSVCDDPNELGLDDYEQLYEEEYKEAD